MANEVCFRTIELDQPWSIQSYESIGGYKCWKKILDNQVSPQEIIDHIKKSGLRGRGGAGFPVGLKWSFISHNVSGQKYIVCNSDEGEPGTCKDREILLNNPHQIIEGMAIAGYVMGATIGYNYIRAEFYDPIQRFERALQEALDKGYLGDNIRNSSFHFNLHISLGAGSYICGEETALLNSIEGKKGQPRFKPPFPAYKGLYGCPTNINNTESYASVPPILLNGPEWFKALGTKNSGGTKLFCISGHVINPKVVEVGLGTSFKSLLKMAGGIKNNGTLKAVIPGGSSSKILTAKEVMDISMDYESIKEAGSMLGSGAVVILDHTTCIVKLLTRLSAFYYEESCGQCSPCREGTGWISRILNRILKGQGHLEDLDTLIRVASNIEGNTICGLGDAAAWPVQSYLEKFPHEFKYMIEHGNSMVKQGI